MGRAAKEASSMSGLCSIREFGGRNLTGKQEGDEGREGRQGKGRDRNARNGISRTRRVSKYNWE
jgi:hypothetical protein